MYKNCTTNETKSQVAKILQKTKKKKMLNTDVVAWLCSIGETDRAQRIDDCATHIGITEIGGYAKIIKADFCRERLCNVCAWRRQTKFVAQMFPVLEILSKDYEFLLVTLTMRSVKLGELKQAIDIMLKGYDRFLKHRQVQRGWAGKVRGLEMKYNSEKKTFNPHIHILVAVSKDYFETKTKYVSHAELVRCWGESIRTDYFPRCEVKKVTETRGAVLETMKYSFKQMKDNTAMQGFHTALKNRRLISFSGVFAETRKLLRQSDFENILTDDIPEDTPQKIIYTLYRFDATGGVYNYYKELEYER